MKASNSSSAPTSGDRVTRAIVALAIRDRSLEAELTARFTACPEFAVLRCSVADAAEFAVWVHGTEPDVLLLDERSLQLLGRSATFVGKRWRPRRVLVVADRSCAALAEHVVRHRLQGFLIAADAAALCTKAVRAVIRGETWLPRGLLVELLLMHVKAADVLPLNVAADSRLTRRETEVVRYVRRGFANKQIADSLAIREDTVKKHLRNAYTKLGVRRRSEIMTAAPAIF